MRINAIPWWSNQNTYPIQDQLGWKIREGWWHSSNETEVEELEEKIDEYLQKDSLAKQHLFNTISDQLLLCIQHLGNTSKIWSKIWTIHEGKTELVQIDLHWKLQKSRCEEGGDVKTHFGELFRICKMLAGMGTDIGDKDFYAILMGSLPESYRPLLSSINATSQIMKQPLTPYELVSVVSKEYEHRQLADQKPTKKTGNSAFSAKTNTLRGCT